MYTWGYIKDACLAKLDLDENEATDQNLLSRFPFYANEAMTQICSAVKPKYTFAHFIINKDEVGQLLNMPDDFVSFGDDVCYMLDVMTGDRYDLTDSDLIYAGTNQVIFTHTGEFYVSYNARWYQFDKEIDDNVEINVPTDILDCLPSYIVSQCYKIDDVAMASIFREEYEIMLSRIDNTNYKDTKTFSIRGGW